MLRKLEVLFKDEDGAGAVEYSLLAVSIAAVIAGAIFALGGQVIIWFQNLNGVF